MPELGQRIQLAVHGSIIGTLLVSLSESRVVMGVQNAAARVAHMARQSFLFQWLTKEPEPDVIVIDLRETWTVGPIIRAIDWMISRIEPY